MTHIEKQDYKEKTECWELEATTNRLKVEKLIKNEHEKFGKVLLTLT